jgi:subtilisin family serine protease
VSQRILALLTLGFFVGSAMVGSVAGLDVADVNTTTMIDGDGESDRYIVAFHEDPGHRPGDSYQGESVVKFIPGLNFIVVETENFPAFDLRTRADQNVRYVEWDNPEYAQLLYTPNDPLHTHEALWGTHRVGAENAWDTTLGSSAVKIAVVDSGLNADHEEFAGQSRVLNGWNFHGGNSDTSDLNGCNWHGTHVAGTLGATIDNGVGIAGLSQSTILPVKIFGSGFFGCSGASSSAIADALRYAGDEGAHISQNSWGGGGSSSAINDAIAYAHNLGTTHVAAAGNSGPCTDCVNVPWVENPDKTIVVSSIEDGDGFSSFSSEGPEVTVTAPGSDVGSSTSGTDGYHVMSGTSMAAPHVSGSLALYLAANGNVGFNELHNVLTSTAEDLGHSTDRQGAGLVRADLMLGSDGGGGDPGNGDDDDDPSDPEPEDDTMHVANIAHSSSGGRPADRDIYATVTVNDGNDNGLDGVETCIEMTRHSDGATASGCAPTDGSGEVTFAWSNAGRDTYTTCVTDLTKSGYEWDQSSDSASDGNCHTSSP